MPQHWIRSITGFVGALAFSHAMAADYGCRTDLTTLTGVVEKYSMVNARVMTPSDMPGIPKHWVDGLAKWLPELPTLQRGFPYRLVEDAARLRVAIYHDHDRVELVSIVFPIVDIPANLQARSFDALTDIVGACLPARPDLGSWLKSALFEAWDNAAALMNRNDMGLSPVVQAAFGEARLTVWGVPPDLWHILITP